MITKYVDVAWSKILATYAQLYRRGYPKILNWLRSIRPTGNTEVSRHIKTVGRIRSARYGDGIEILAQCPECSNNEYRFNITAEQRQRLIQGKQVTGFTWDDSWDCWVFKHECSPFKDLHYVLHELHILVYKSDLTEMRRVTTADSGIFESNLFG